MLDRTVFGSSRIQGVFCVYYVVATEDPAARKGSITFLTIITSQVISTMQMLSIFDVLYVIWPEPFATMLSVASLLNFDLDVLSVNCVVSHSALLKYTGNLLFVIVLLVAITTVHVLHVLIFREGRFRERWEARGVPHSRQNLCQPFEPATREAVPRQTMFAGCLPGGRAEGEITGVIHALTTKNRVSKMTCEPSLG